MGSMTFTVNRGSPATNGSKTFTIPDAQVTRFFAFVQATYPKNADGSDASLGQSLVMWADGIMAGTVGNVLNYERGGAAKTASDAITPIQPT